MIPESIRKSPALAPALALAAGITTSVEGVSLAWLATIVLLATIIIAATKFSSILAVATYILGFCLGIVSSPVNLPTSLNDRQASYSGIVELRHNKGWGQTIRVQVDSVNGHPIEPMLFHINYSHFDCIPRAAQRIHFSGKAQSMSSVDIFENSPSGFMKRSGVTAQMAIYETDVKIIGDEPGLLNSIRRLSHSLSERIVSLPIEPNTASFLTTIIAANTEIIDQDLRDDYAIAGIAHLLSISGLHVGIILAIISLILYPLNICGLRRTKIVISIAVLWVFAIMAGMVPSVMRAVVIATISGIGLFLGRRHSPLNSLAIAVMIILFVAPSSIIMPGFQLTVLATLAIIIVAPILSETFRRRSRLLYIIASGIIIPIAAIIATGILAAYYFHVFPVYFLISNILASIIIPPLMFLSIILIILPLPWLGTIIDKIFQILTESVAILNNLPQLPEIYFRPSSVLIYYILLLGIVYFGASYKTPDVE